MRSHAAVLVGFVHGEHWVGRVDDGRAPGGSEAAGSFNKRVGTEVGGVLGALGAASNLNVLPRGRASRVNMHPSIHAGIMRVGSHRVSGFVAAGLHMRASEDVRVVHHPVQV